MNARAADLVQQAVTSGQVPGAALGMVRTDEAAQLACWGLAAREPANRIAHAHGTGERVELVTGPASPGVAARS